MTFLQMNVEFRYNTSNKKIFNAVVFYSLHTASTALSYHVLTSVRHAVNKYN